jgi:hypothetical protein
MEQEILCETCKNNFVSKVARDYKDAFTSNSFCVYTHEREKSVECSFYNRIPNSIEIEKIKDIETDTSDSDRMAYQDVNRTYTTGERQLNNRFDCRTAA